MRTAFAVWDGRIAPVFDVARHLHIVETDGDRIVGEADEALADHVPAHRAFRLAELGVGTLVCGAISRLMEDIVAAHGIRVIPFVAGDLGDIVRAWFAGGVESDQFAMPGCCGRFRRHRRRGRRTGRGRGGACRH